MIIDIDKSLAVAAAEQQLIPWDLSVRLRGIDMKVRPLSNADLAEIARIESSNHHGANNLVNGLFEGWTTVDFSDDEIGAILIAVATFVKERLKKKSRSLAAEIASQISRSMSGN